MLQKAVKELLVFITDMGDDDYSKRKGIVCVLVYRKIAQLNMPNNHGGSVDSQLA